MFWGKVFELQEKNGRQLKWTHSRTKISLYSKTLGGKSEGLWGNVEVAQSSVYSLQPPPFWIEISWEDYQRAPKLGLTEFVVKIRFRQKHWFSLSLVSYKVSQLRIPNNFKALLLTSKHYHCYPPVIAERKARSVFLTLTLIIYSLRVLNHIFAASFAKAEQ